MFAAMQQARQWPCFRIVYIEDLATEVFSRVLEPSCRCPRANPTIAPAMTNATPAAPMRLQETDQTARRRRCDGTSHTDRLKKKIREPNKLQ